MKITYGQSVHGNDEINAVVKTIKKSTQMGENVKKFEKKIAKLLSKKNGVMVNSITDETLTEGIVRLYVNNLQEVAFDNLVVKVIGMDGQPLLKPLSE